MIVDQVHMEETEVEDVENRIEELPDMMQPVLLEIQSVKVHGLAAKIMFDNGSTAALVTHSFAKRAGLTGTMVTYWLVVVGHDKVLRG